MGAEAGVGDQNGPEGFSADYRVRGVLRLYLAGAEVGSYTIGPVAPLWLGGTLLRLPQPVAADRLVFTITQVSGKRYGGTPPAALSEIG